MMNGRIERLKELLKQSPEDSFVKFALAKENEKLGRMQKAIDILSDLIDKQPDYVGAYYHLGVLLKEENKIDEAVKMYQRGIKVAETLRDLHSLSELRNARMNLEMEIE